MHTVVLQKADLDIAAPAPPIEADRMGAILGDDYDLVLLQQMLTDRQDKFAGAADIELFPVSIKHRRNELQEHATSFAEGLFIESPVDFGCRLNGY